MNKQALQSQNSKKQNSSSQSPKDKSGNYGDLPIRIVSGLILAIVVIGFLWLGGLGFSLLMSLMAVLIHWEWARMTRTQTTAIGQGLSWVFLLIALGAMLANQWLSSLLVLGIGFLMLLILSVTRQRPLWSAVGLIYAAGGAMAMVALRANETYGVAMILFLFAIVWLTDTGAYGCGRLIGGAKFAPKISPKKTWAGFIGGVSIGTLCGCLFIYFWFGALSFTGIAVALFLSIFSQYGDLFESWIKRYFGVKDSSQIIPGHGGVMDRVDGLSPAALAFALMAAILYFLEPKAYDQGLGDVYNIAVAAVSILT